VTVYSFNENGTVTVKIGADFNHVLFERQVFGVAPEDIEPCEIPDKSGSAMLSSEEVGDNIDVLRVLVRPDVFIMGEDGTARRKQ
jgi:hypothetical protein